VRQCARLTHVPGKRSHDSGPAAIGTLPFEGACDPRLRPEATDIRSITRARVRRAHVRRWRM